MVREENIEYAGVVWEIDPTGKFDEVPSHHLSELAGFIPTFFNENYTNENIIENALKMYTFGGPPMTGFTIDEQGCLSYPGDPVLYPILKTVIKETTVRVYHHGIISFVCGDTFTAYRFD